MGVAGRRELRGGVKGKSGLLRRFFGRRRKESHPEWG